jgi:acetyl esterase
MPLDPQAQAFLEQLAATGAPPLHELSVAEARQVIVELFRTTGDPEPVGAVAERTIPGTAGEMPIMPQRELPDDFERRYPLV